MSKTFKQKVEHDIAAMKKQAAIEPPRITDEQWGTIWDNGKYRPATKEEMEKQRNLIPIDFLFKPTNEDSD